MAKTRKKMTKAQAMKALDWAMGHLGLQAWRIVLDYTNDIPEWISDNPFLARVSYNLQYRTAKIWVGPARCYDEDVDSLQSLFHEAVHVGLEAANVPHQAPLPEFIIDRLADALAFAYRHKMKPWRK